MGRVYKNPPIVEAVCEFRFDPSSEWDLAVLGLVYKRVQKQFPKRHRALEVGVQVQATLEEVKPKISTADMMRFLQDDERAFIQVGPNLLSVNHLTPYPTWSGFVPLIKKGFKAYKDEVEPKAIHRIGLRYINKIEIQGKVLRLEDYFHFRPFLGEGLPQSHGAFITGVNLVFEDGRDILRLQLTTTEAAKSGAMAFFLDLDYFLTKPGAVELGSVFEWVEMAHGRVEKIFEDCISDKLRSLFEEVRE